MKKFLIAITSIIVILSQTTACVIRYKLPENDVSDSSSESSEYIAPVINLDTTRTVGSYLIKNIVDGDVDGVEIIRYTGDGSGITVPKEIDGFPVISIGNDAFADLKSTRSITVPNGVKTIGDDAFNNCRELMSVELPDSVTKIGERAFADCVKLTSFRIPEKITTIEAYTFYNCYVVSEITIPDGITSIEKGAFFNCAKLTGVILPEKLKTLEAEGFYSCFELTSIKLPDSLEYLGKRVFDNCFNLDRIYFKGEVYNVNLDDEHYDHSELRLAVNGELEEEEEDSKK